MCFTASRRLQGSPCVRVRRAPSLSSAAFIVRFGRRSTVAAYVCVLRVCVQPPAVDAGYNRRKGLWDSYCHDRQKAPVWPTPDNCLSPEQKRSTEHLCMLSVLCEPWHDTHRARRKREGFTKAPLVPRAMRVHEGCLACAYCTVVLLSRPMVGTLRYPQW